jgi:CRISPR system Cascade subunit CasA
MTYSYHLLEETWIPCVLPDGRREDMSIREVLRRAHEIREVADASPLATIAMHRLLLAILHRVFGPSDASAWIALWEVQRFDAGSIKDYLDEWTHRFDLFHAERPFFQTTETDVSYAKPVSNIVLERSPSNARLFTHIDESTVLELTPAQAARQVLAYLSFAVGGLITPEAGKLADKYCAAAPLNRCAVTLVTGESLFQTLLLNLHRCNAEYEQPFSFDPEKDAPAWEQAFPARVEERRPFGPIDLLTWQSRRVRLVPSNGDGGTAVVRQVVAMKGVQFPRGDNALYQWETMVAFRHNAKAKPEQDPWPPMAFREERAIWRDSLALFSLSPEAQRPATMTWLSEVLERPRRVLPVDVFGVSTDQANIDLWRHERIQAPLVYLRDEELRERLKDALSLAESAQSVVRGATRQVAELLLAPGADAGGREGDPKAISARADSMGAVRLYWAPLGAPFSRFLVDQAQAEATDEGYDRAPLEEWWESARRSALDAFQTATSSLDGSGRHLHALVAGERRLLIGLRKIENERNLRPEKVENGNQSA